MSKSAKIAKTRKPSLDNASAKRFIDEVLSAVSACRTSADLEAIPGRFPYGAWLVHNMPGLPGTKFPRLHFNIAAGEIKNLMESGLIDESYRIKPDVSTGTTSAGYQLSSLEKILYALLWKNGDLGKERHFISGIMGEDNDDGEGPVFRNFGRYVEGSRDYIIDQHTLRCFAVHASSAEAISLARSLGVINGRNPRHLGWIAEYDKFYEVLREKIKDNRSDFFYTLDQLLFSVGKMVKLNGAQVGG